MTIPAIDILKEVLEDAPPVRSEETTVARVADATPGGLVLTAGSQTWKAKRAATCLLAPHAGDEVLMTSLSDGRAYVLAILERPDTKTSQLILDGDASIQARSGSLQVSASGEMDFVSPKAVSVTTEQFGLRASAANLFVDTLQYIGNQIASDVHKMKTKVGTFDSVAERISQRVVRSYRSIEESEHVRAGELDISAKKNLRLHAKNAVLTALALVKVDGEQIHMG